MQVNWPSVMVYLVFFLFFVVGPQCVVEEGGDYADTFSRHWRNTGQRKRRISNTAGQMRQIQASGNPQENIKDPARLTRKEGNTEDPHRQYGQEKREQEP